MKEEWKDVIGYEGYYEVSNLGVIRSVDRVVNNQYKKFVTRGRIMKSYVNRIGYHINTLSLNGNAKHHFLHRVIAKVFISNPENKPQINHINGVKTDNRLENLEWVTASDNVKHAYNTGLKTPSSNKVLMLSKDNKPLLWFDSSVEASNAINKNQGQGNISRCANGIYKTAYGYKWKYI